MFELFEVCSGLGEPRLGLLALGCIQVADRIGPLLAGPAARGHQFLDLAKQGLSRANGRWRLVDFLEGPKQKQRIFEETIPRSPRSLAPGCVEQADISIAQVLAGYSGCDPLTSRAIRSGPRNQKSHGCLGSDLTLANLLLDIGRQIGDQGQTTRYPALGSVEAPRQLLLAPSEAAMQLVEQPALLEGRITSRGAKALGQKQRIGLGGVQEDRLDRVLAETFQHTNPFEAIDHQEPVVGLGLGHNDNRDLLARRAHRAQQVLLLGAAANAQIPVAKVELVKLQFHRRTLLVRRRPKHPLETAIFLSAGPTRRLASAAPRSGEIKKAIACGCLRPSAASSRDGRKHSNDPAASWPRVRKSPLAGAKPPARPSGTKLRMRNPDRAATAMPRSCIRYAGPRGRVSPPRSRPQLTACRAAVAGGFGCSHGQHPSPSTGHSTDDGSEDIAPCGTARCSTSGFDSTPHKDRTSRRTPGTHKSTEPASLLLRRITKQDDISSACDSLQEALPYQLLQRERPARGLGLLRTAQALAFFPPLYRAEKKSWPADLRSTRFRPSVDSFLRARWWTHFSWRDPGFLGKRQSLAGESVLLESRSLRLEGPSTRKDANAGQDLAVHLPNPGPKGTEATLASRSVRPLTPLAGPLLGSSRPRVSPQLPGDQTGSVLDQEEVPHESWMGPTTTSEVVTLK